MTHLKRFIIISLLSTLALIARGHDLLSAATIPCAKGDPVVCSETDTLDYPIVRVNGVLVGTALGNPIFSPLANQALAAGTVIQHSNSMTFIELVRISSTGGAVTSSATPRIEAGVDGQIIILQGTSATNTYTIPTGSGVLWRAASIVFDDLTSLVLTYKSSVSAWVEGVTTTGGGGGITEWSGDITPAQITAATHNYNPTGLSTATVVRVSTNASQDLTGLAGGSDGRMIILRNVGSQNLVLRSENASSTADNRFGLTADITMLPKALVLLQYDATASVGARRWGAIFSSAAAVGGGGDVEKPPAFVATTGPITLASPGVTHDGMTVVSGQRMLVWQQTTASENGCYTFNGGTSLMTRTTDCDETSEFTNNFTIKVQSGTLYGGVTFMLQTTGVVNVNTSNIFFAVESWGTKAEVLTNKGVNSGYMPLNTLGKAPWNRLDTPAIHADLSATSQINVPALLSSQGANVIAIQNSGAGNVILTTGNPRIVGCTSGNDGVRILLVGLSTTKTVTIPNGQGVLLAGATGSATVGIPPGGSPTEFRCNGATTTWEQIGGGGQTFPLNPNVTIYACGDARNPVFGSDAGGNKFEWCLDGSNNPTQRAFCGGTVSCNSTTQLSVGTIYCVKKHDGTNLFCVDNDTGVITGTITGSMTTTDEKWNDAAGCNDTTPGHIWDVPTTNPAVAACDTASNTQKGVLTYNDTTDQAIHFKFRLPTGYVGMDFIPRWKAAAITGAVGWCVRLGRVAVNGGTSNPTLIAEGAGNCVSDTADPQTLEENEAVIANPTCTGCVAGDLIYGVISRDAGGTVVTDTMSGNALLLGWTRRVRIIQP